MWLWAGSHSESSFLESPSLSMMGRASASIAIIKRMLDTFFDIVLTPATEYFPLAWRSELRGQLSNRPKGYCVQRRTTRYQLGCGHFRLRVAARGSRLLHCGIGLVGSKPRAMNVLQRVRRARSRRPSSYTLKQEECTTNALHSSPRSLFVFACSAVPRS